MELLESNVVSIKQKDKENNIEDIKENDKNQIEEKENMKLDIVYSHKEKYNSRDISWIEFNKRVLDMADNDSIPMLEKLKYVGISANNLDEYMMVRVGGLLKLVNSNSIHTNINGMLPKEEYKIINNEIKSFINRQYEILNKLRIEFNNNGIKLIQKKSDITPKGKKYIQKYFEDRLYGAITPIVFDNSRPFPLINNKSINIGVLLEDTRFNFNMFGTIQVPNMPRLVEIKAKDIPSGERHFMLIEDIIKFNLNRIFINKKIIDTCCYRVLRNFDDDLDEKPNVFLADKMKESLKRRESGEIVYLQITKSKKEMLKIIQSALSVDKTNVIKLGNHAIDLRFAMESAKMSVEEKRKYKFRPFTPQLGRDLFGEHDILDAIDREDVLLHHPYESYDSVVNFVKEASTNKDVVSIKQTLYRLSSDSPIMQSLIKAAENGKQVTVLLEIKARFNEKDNLLWASKLENAGGHVIYGVNDLKTHCKLTIVTKKGKKNNLKQYCHIGTGNYNDVTAKLYTDLSLFTSNKSICEDVTNLFNMLTGFSEPILNRILYAPHNLRGSLLKLIDKEIESGKEGKIIIKVNSLTDKTMIDKLYEASQAGVSVNLIVRGACSLVTGLNCSQNIRVVSNIGRFLEHSRICYFKNSNNLYIGSADLMERNLDKRFETMTPILNDLIKLRIINILNLYLDDPTGYDLHGKIYSRRLNPDNKPSAQEVLCKKAEEFNKIKNVNKLFIVKK